MAHPLPLIIDESIEFLQRQRFSFFLIKRLIENGDKPSIYEELFHLLLERGCDLQSEQGSEALFHIPTDSYLPSEEYISSRDIDAGGLFICKLFNLLLTHGADFNGSFQGYTLLQYLLRISPLSRDFPADLEVIRVTSAATSYL